MAQNFELGLGEHFQLTAEYAAEILKTTKYSWTPAGIDYDLPELTTIDYRTQCPLFEYLIIKKPQGSVEAYECLSVWRKSPYVVVRSTHEELDLLQLKQVCGAISYLRFKRRDLVRKHDIDTWESLFETHVVSDYTVPICSEDLELCYSWANEVFPNNCENASVGKAGEFAFATWAGENKLAISHIEVNKNDGPDKYDFLGNGSIKIDVKTYHDDLTTGSKHNRRHWNISSTSVKGSYAKELFVFVVLAEDKKTATIVGMCSVKQILDKGKPYSFDFDQNLIYRIEEKDLLNPDLLRAYLDPSAMLNISSSFNPTKEIAEQIKSYGIDTLSQSYMNEDVEPWEVENYNLVKRASKKSKRKNPKGFG